MSLTGDLARQIDRVVKPAHRSRPITGIRWLVTLAAVPCHKVELGKKRANEHKPGMYSREVFEKAYAPTG